jgi:hypothetical protein
MNKAFGLLQYNNILLTEYLCSIKYICLQFSRDNKSMIWQLNGRKIEAMTSKGTSSFVLSVLRVVYEKVCLLASST